MDGENFLVEGREEESKKKERERLTSCDLK